MDRLHRSESLVACNSLQRMVALCLSNLDLMAFDVENPLRSLLKVRMHQSSKSAPNAFSPVPKDRSEAESA